ncbi:hypothetical protein CsSME_00017018 [Camellia sinensis var. sinensis]
MAAQAHADDDQEIQETQQQHPQQLPTSTTTIELHGNQKDHEKLLSSYLGLSFTVFLGLIPKPLTLSVYLSLLSTSPSLLLSSLLSPSHLPQNPSLFSKEQNPQISHQWKPKPKPLTLSLYLSRTRGSSLVT